MSTLFRTAFARTNVQARAEDEAASILAEANAPTAAIVVGAPVDITPFT